MKTKITFILLLTSVIVLAQNTFATTEVQITNLVSGTLYMPAKNNLQTNLVIVIAGSGPTNRDGNQQGLTNNSLKMLCESLANSGTAAFSFDKRIIAQMKTGTIDENTLRFNDMIDDAKSVITHFKLQKKYDKIIVAGHSEGSLIGMVAANGNSNAFISLSGAGRPIDEILEEQIVKQMPSIKTVLRERLNDLKAEKLIDPASIDPALAGMFRKSVQPYLISWIQLNPQIEIKKLQIPVLIINGDKDIQVPITDAVLLHQSLPTAKIEIIANMNHIFKTITGDDATNRASYTDPTLPISVDLLASINLFLRGLK